jgi:hypothetical protein
MGTRSHIGKKLQDGTIKYIYCHWDGYLGHNGVILKEYYTNEAKIDALLELGDLSSLGEEIGEQQDFNIISTHNDKWCLAYGRDRGNTNTQANIAQTLKDMIGQSYNYVWDNEKWYCYGGDGQELVN